MLKSKKNIWIVGLVAVVTVAGFSLISTTDKNTSKNDPQNTQSYLKPVDSFQHAHGLAVDVNDPKKLLIATHNGLFMLQNDKDLYQVGPKKDDYMGFSPHPTDSNTFFTSGHPKGGGNIGFQKTSDGGKSWQKVSDGINGPVDFHAMTVSRVNPNLAYGSYAGKLQRSLDGGKKWEQIDTNLTNVISLVSDPVDANTVYAATTDGIMSSSDQGNTWADAAPDVSGAAVTVLAINQTQTTEWISFSEKLGLAKSSDSGKSWKTLKIGAGDDIVLQIANDNKNPQVTYALTRANVVYKTTDGGESWQKVR